MSAHPTPQRRQAQEAAKRHRLLADPSRLELVLLLTDGPRTVTSLADALGLHVNTVRAHLERLLEGGLVTQERQTPDGRGRPASRFSLSAEGLRQSSLSGRDYRLLSEVLLHLLRSESGRNVENAAEQSGEAWGRHLAGSHPPRPGSEPAAGEAAALAKNILERLHFAPELQETNGGWDVVLHNCPYKEIARENADVVCSFHRGMLNGVLKMVGSDIEAVSLEPFVQPDICKARLEHPAAKKKRSSGKGALPA